MNPFTLDLNSVTLWISKYNF